MKDERSSELRGASQKLLIGWTALRRMHGPTVTNAGSRWMSNELQGDWRERQVWLRTTNHRRSVSSVRVSKAEIASESRKSWRYSVGLTLQTSRKTCAKCCWVLKPQATATSNTRASGARNIALARSILWRRTN